MLWVSDLRAPGSTATADRRPGGGRSHIFGGILAHVISSRLRRGRGHRGRAGPGGCFRQHTELAGRFGHGHTHPGQQHGADRRGASDPDTTVTFAVTSGALTITAPTAADLGSGAPGTTISGALGSVTVTDNRALLSASWTATASPTSFTTGSGTTPETIPATDAGYAPGPLTTTGTITATPHTITLSGSPQAVVSRTAGTGNNTASWDPTVSVAVPASAVFGTYTGTIAHSVS